MFKSVAVTDQSRPKSRHSTNPTKNDSISYPIQAPLWKKSFQQLCSGNSYSIKFYTLTITINTHSSKLCLRQSFK